MSGNEMDTISELKLQHDGEMDHTNRAVIDAKMERKAVEKLYRIRRYILETSARERLDLIQIIGFQCAETIVARIQLHY